MTARAFRKMIAKKPDAINPFLNLALESHASCLDPVMYIRHADKKVDWQKCLRRTVHACCFAFYQARKAERDNKGVIHLEACKRGATALYEPGQGDWIGTGFG